MSVGPRDVTLSWSPPEESERNGVISSYTLACAGGGGLMADTITTSDLTAVVGNLNPYSRYVCTVSASTSAGTSPPATLNFTTATDSKQ